LSSVLNCTTVAAVLAGHIHSAQAQVFGHNATPQLVAAAGVDDGRRLIEFSFPADSAAEAAGTAASAQPASGGANL
jgi:hypothetical protein